MAIFCELINPQVNISCDPDSGENLDAVEIENETHRLHIGTEDGEVMRFRAMRNDWMPKRYEHRLGSESIHYSFTEYIDFGHKTTIPELFKGEEIYFQFLVATNPIKLTKEIITETDTLTWLAVDRSKIFLDEYLNGRRKS